MKQVIVNIVKSTSAIVIVAILLFSTVSFLAAASPNYARSTELNWLEFKGYVQIQPSYRELRSGGLLPNLARVPAMRIRQKICPRRGWLFLLSALFVACEI